MLDDANKQELVKGVVERVAPEHSGVYRKDLITVIERAKGSGDCARRVRARGRVVAPPT